MSKQIVDYKLYLVTDRDILGDRDLAVAIEQSIIGGATVIQLREKDISTKDFYEIALKIKEVTTKYKVPLIINDRLDIALAIDADGLHIGQADMPLAIARKYFGEDKIIGVSATTMEQALKAQSEGADYLGVGAVFPTTTKNDAEYVPLPLLKEIKEIVKIPVVAIGGISEANAALAMATGIDGISVVSAILGKVDIRKATEELKNRL